jgi:hypothetical protein
MIFNNTSDRVLAAAAVGQPVIEVPLPPGAANLQFQEGTVGQQYEVTPDGFAYLAPVRPGPNAVELLFTFELPLETAQTFTQQLRYPIDALNVLMPPDGLQLASVQLTGPVAQEVQGTQFLAYTGANLPAGSELTLSLVPATAWPNWLAPTLAVLGMGVFIAAWVWRWQLRRQRPTEPGSTPALDPTQRRAALIAALAQLDDDFALGRLAEPEHRRRRAKLKAAALDISRQIQSQSRLDQ